MATADLAQQTYLPEHVEQLGRVYDFIAAHEDRHGVSPTPRYVLAGPEPHDQIEVPAEVHRALRQVVDALRAGRAVTVAPHNTVLTTQQAADLLNVSRPTVVKLIEAGEIPCERTTHRRQVLLRDVLDYRQRRRREQYDALLAADVDVDEEDPDEVLTELKEARRAVAAKRRSRAGL